MKLTVDTNEKTLVHEAGGEERVLDLYTEEAFKLISHAWVKVGWAQRYSYTFTWLGRPIIQLPEDTVRLQEVIYRTQPDVIVETGVAHGGSLIFYASLCKSMEKGRVVGVDIEIRPHNREAIESHPLSTLITLIEGDSAAPDIVDRVRAEVRPGEKVLVFLDSNHSKEHVLTELSTYAPLVTEGSYIVAMDGVMEQVADAPGAAQDWTWNNPKNAAHEFVENNPDFTIEEPPFLFDEGNVSGRVTYWPDAFIKRVR